MSDKKDDFSENKSPNAGGGQNPRRPAPANEQELQWELESQLRDFGVTLSDGLRYGFEGRGQELGDRAKGVGYAVLDAVNYGLSEAGRALNEAQNRTRTGGAPQNSADYSGYYAKNDSGAAGTSRPNYGAAFGRRPEGEAGTRGYDYTQGFRTYAGRAEERIRARTQRRNGSASALRQSGITRFAIGLAQTIPGGILTFGLLLSGLICIAAAPYAPVEAVNVTAIVGWSLTAAGLPFVWLTFSGARSLGAAGRLKAYAEAIGTETGISLDYLAGAVQRPVAKVRKDVKKLIRKGWMTAWYDEHSDILYTTAEGYRAARLAAEQTAEGEAPAPQSAQTDRGEAETANGAKSALSLETVLRFADVLAAEQKIMEDAQAVEELAHMEKTTRAIGEWLSAHPDSAPKARRFADYYVPTTLKLLHTYNEVKGQKGDNAENIRRDIAGILHTLNTAFDNLHDTLLSDVALDISGEIAALQGMLARDGLTGEGLL